jgi:hypothetical protein
MKNKHCEVCDDSIHPQAKLCARCKKLFNRGISKKVIVRNKEARLNALKLGYNKMGKYFECFYTHVRLVEDNHRSPRYLTFDHKTPRNESEMVLAAQLINDMKSDMDESEFKNMVQKLANHFAGESFDDSAFNVIHWKR